MTDAYIDAQASLWKAQRHIWQKELHLVRLLDVRIRMRALWIGSEHEHVDCESFPCWDWWWWNGNVRIGLVVRSCGH
jgi:hypothetical protein